MTDLYNIFVTRDKIVTESNNRHSLPLALYVSSSMGRPVVFGTKSLAGPLATHWAIKVGDTWYEIPGTSPQNKGEANVIQTSKGQKSKGGAEPTSCSKTPSVLNKETAKILRVVPLS